jgi:hypothetical protein
MPRLFRLVGATAFLMWLCVEIAASQTSSALLTSDLQRQYPNIKQVLADLVGQQQAEWRARAKAEGQEIAPPGAYDLDHCSSGAEYLGDLARDDKLSYLANLAYDALSWSDSLTEAKYPPETWSGSLKQYENAQISDIRRLNGSQLQSGFQNRKQNFLRQITGRLASYRKTHTSLPEVSNEGACHRRLGRGEINLQIETDPSGAAVLIIPVFFYEICKAQKLDPDDNRACNRWRDALNGRVTPVSGDYIFLARWPDGAKRQGKLSAIKYDMGTLIIQKQ